MYFKSKEQKRALFLSVLLLILLLGCLLCIVLRGNSVFGSDIISSDKETQIIADIYQDGTLLQSIRLDTITEAYTFIVTGENDAENKIEVRPGSIGILSASCPDKLCVHQGFISNSLLPITCLPNRLVIQVRVEEPLLHETSSSEANDILTY